MEKLRTRFNVSFRAKVLVPVIAVMILLLAVTMFVVNLHLTEQAETDARDSLATADAVFKNSQQIRTRNLFLRFRNLPNEPRYKSALQTHHPETIQGQLAAAMTEQEIDFVLFTPSRRLSTDDAAEDDPVAPQLQRRDQLIPAVTFVEAAAELPPARSRARRSRTPSVSGKNFSTSCPCPSTAPATC